MTTNNYIIPTSGSGGSGELPTTQPATAGLWNDGGVVKFWNGVTNVIMDTVSNSDPNSVVDEQISTLPNLP